MFGNALGWCLSLILVIATVGSIAYIDRTTRPTPPDAFGLIAENSAPLSLPDIGDIVSQQPGEADATAQYSAALDLVSNHRDAFDVFAQSSESETPKAVTTALQLLTQAARFSGGSIFQTAPQLLIHYNNESPKLKDAQRLGKASMRAAQIVRTINPAAAMAHLQAAFVLGHRLFDERITYEELNLGLQLLAESAAAMKQLARETGAADRLGRIEAFDAQRLSLTKTRVLPIASRIRTLDGATLSANVGNIRNWAKDKSTDRVWRVEATLALGRLRFGVGPTGTSGDQTAAGRALQVLLKDEDAKVRAAAAQGRALTIEQFRQLR